MGRRRRHARDGSRREPNRGGLRSVDGEDRQVVGVGLVDISEIELGLRQRASRCPTGELGRQTEVTEDLVDDVGIVDVA
jgi:hypothetical protein